MDLNDLKFNPELKQDYVLTLNNSVGYIDNMACYCTKHRCFVSKKQISSGNRHCFESKVAGNKNCIYCVEITKENLQELIKSSAIEEMIDLYAG